jgi:L-ascorbate metabolism protein UlaG (beta-lactamase superfamily)
MRIQYLGHASFLLTTDAGTRIVTDPFDPEAYRGSFRYRAFRDQADIVTISHEHGDHNAAHIVSGSPIVIKGNGKFVANEVEFAGIATAHDDSQGARRGGNTVFVISADGLRIAHLGDLGHVLTADQAAEIGSVDVALVPVGGYYTIDAGQAWEVIGQIDARVAIPMHYRNEKCDFPIAGVDEFIKGRPNVRREGVSTFEISTQNLPEERCVVVLEPSL